MSVFAEHFTLTYLCCFFLLAEKCKSSPLGVADFRGNPLLTLAGRHRRTVFPLFLALSGWTPDTPEIHCPVRLTPDHPQNPRCWTHLTKQQSCL